MPFHNVETTDAVAKRRAWEVAKRTRLCLARPCQAKRTGSLPGEFSLSFEECEKKSPPKMSSVFSYGKIKKVTHIAGRVEDVFMPGSWEALACQEPGGAIQKGSIPQEVFAMTNLKHAHNELFRRGPDETFQSLSDLAKFCRDQKEKSTDLWIPPKNLEAATNADFLNFGVVDGERYQLNDWSFTQLCQLAKVGKETVNRLSPDTAARVFRETLPSGNKPLQLFTEENRVRSIHQASYTRLHNAEVVSMLQEFAVDFSPPQKAMTGGTGLYAGEQDMFCFLIDPLGWTEIEGENFAPGFFVWNSEVGKRSVGISTFWFQAVCENHIVWDAIEVVEVTRKHTANVSEVLGEIRRTIEDLVNKRDARKDGFANAIRKAMSTTLGEDADEVLKVLAEKGITRTLAKKALDLAIEKGRFTIFSVVDALTRLAGEAEFIGDRTVLDEKAASLLALAA